MDFSIDTLHSFEKEMLAAEQKILKTVKISCITDLNHSTLMRQNKDPLASMVQDLVKLFNSNLNLCKSAANKLDRMKSEQIELQNRLLNLQQNDIDSVQETVKTEMSRTWAEVAKKNSSTSAKTFTAKEMKKVVKSTVSEEDRSQSFIIYGAPERGDQDNPAVEAELVFEQTISKPYPHILTSYRIGTRQSDKTRPIKVRLLNTHCVQQVLRNGYKLRANEEFKDIYLAPDRNKEERLAHSQLVAEMRRLIAEDSSKRYVIRNNRVVCVDNILSRSAENE